MNGLQNRKGQDLQKPFPGCMGRMINIFDLSSGMPRTKLLTEKPHQDVAQVHTNRPDAVKKKAMDNFGVQEDKRISGRKYFSKNSGGTPMKMLIAQEMSREPQSKQKPSNIVAKLMGLDTLPVQQSVLSAKRNLQEDYSHKSLSGEFRGYWQQEDKDVHEVWQQPSRNTRFKDKPPLNRRHDGTSIEKRMALVYQKFTEAKRLATDEKLLQTKEFQEALDVLSSNRDLFLKVFEEPNALFSKHLPEPQTIPPGPQTRRITVLKPSKTMEPKGEAQERKLLNPAIEDFDGSVNMKLTSTRNPNFVHRQAESMSQPTRIVVLKPNPGMSHDMKAGVASVVTSSKPLEGRECCESLGPDEATESREMAKEITRQMQEHVSSNQKDEILLSSTLSNGYVGDESSFTRSENNYMKEECDNESDSESLSPNSRHSWDNSFRLGSPFSISSFSQAYSLEPSVIKEAKKRLSERLAMVSSNGTSQEQSQVCRSSSTLAEMLAIAEAKKEEGADNLTISSRRSYSGEKDQRASTACLSIDGVEGGGCSEDSQRNLPRSKSVPLSSSVYENIGLREGAHASIVSQSVVPKEVVVKSKSGMSSFKGKVSSLFLSRIKKAGKEKPIPSCSVGMNHSEASGKRNDASSESFPQWHSKESILGNSEGKSGVSFSSTSLNGQKQGASMLKGSLSFEKSRASDNFRENQDQPSPISVLEVPFEDDSNSSSFCLPSASAISGHPQALSRSPPIGSILRTLTWEDPREIPHKNTLKLSRVLSRECEQQERFLLVQKLLSYANLLDNTECSTILARWHSLESPLDPILLDEFLDMKEQAKCREKRSNQRLLFDCVNAALLSIGQATLVSSYPWATSYGWVSKGPRTYAPVSEEVSRLVKDWFSCEERQVLVEAENQNLVVDKLVKEEIAGSGWAESMFWEVDEFSREIGKKVLEELVEEALGDLTDGCL